MTEHQHRNLAIDRLELLQRSDDEDGRLAHARLRLAEHVGAHDGLRDAFLAVSQVLAASRTLWRSAAVEVSHHALLNLTGVLEAQIGDG